LAKASVRLRRHIPVQEAVVHSAGSATSSNAFLTVIIPPTLAVDSWAGYPVLDLRSMLSSNFVVQYKSDLGGTNWVDLLLDPDGGDEPARFYRAFMRRAIFRPAGSEG